MDFECLVNIESILNHQEYVLGKEPLQHCERHNKEMIVCNAFMACASKLFFKKYLRGTKKHSICERPSCLVGNT